MRFPRWCRLAVLPAALVLLAAISLPASGAPRPARVARNVNVSRLLGNQAETTIAINPTNPDNVVVASNVQFGGELFEAYSFDGGATWTARTVAGGSDGLQVACCDPSLAFDAFGNLYLVYLDTKAHDIEMALSTDGGVTFRALPAVESTSKKDATGSSTKGGSFVDQPTVATGPGGTAAPQAVWVTYKLYSLGQYLRARGAPVTGLGEVGAFADNEQVPGRPSKDGSFGDIVVGPAGQVMVTYQDNIPTEGPSSIYVNLDPDGLGPLGFGSEVLATTTNVGGFDFIGPQPNRSVDAESGLAWRDACAGRVFLVYTDEEPQESDDTNVFVRHSDDAGATWSAPTRVNDDAGTNSQFNPHIELDPTTGAVGVSFYDARNDLGTGGSGDTDGVPNTDAQYFASASRDCGASFPNVRVSAGTSNAPASENVVEYGDYNDMAFFGGVIRPAWADNSNSTRDNPDGTLSKLDVYTAAVAV